MKWRPIMFHTTLIPRVMDGTKTQSRRLVNMDTLRVWLPREVRSDLWDEMPASQRRVAKKGLHRARIGDAGAVFIRELDFGVKPGEFHFRCPLADGETVLVQRDSGKKEWTVLPAPDQRLWVKETWQAWRQTSVEYDDWEIETDPDRLQQCRIEYRATSESQGPWRSGRFMPRWVSRTSLGVSLVRLQPLMDISEEDAQAEAIPGPHLGRWTDAEGHVQPPEDQPPRPWAHSFFVAWKEIHKVESSAVFANPWVWAYTFTKIKGT